VANERSLSERLVLSDGALNSLPVSQSSSFDMCFTRALAFGVSGGIDFSNRTGAKPVSFTANNSLLFLFAAGTPSKTRLEYQ